MIGTKSGVWRTQSVRRKLVEQKWPLDNMLMVGGVPWRLSDDDHDGPAPRGGVIRLDGGGVLDEAESGAEENPKDRASQSFQNQPGGLPETWLHAEVPGMSCHPAWHDQTEALRLADSG